MTHCDWYSKTNSVYNLKKTLNLESRLKKKYPPSPSHRTNNNNLNILGIFSIISRFLTKGKDSDLIIHPTKLLYVLALLLSLLDITDFTFRWTPPTSYIFLVQLVGEFLL